MCARAPLCGASLPLYRTLSPVQTDRPHGKKRVRRFRSRSHTIGIRVPGAIVQTGPSQDALQLTQSSSVAIEAEAEAGSVDDYVQCDLCNKWRLVVNPITSERWVCAENADHIYNHCDVPQNEWIQTDAEVLEEYTQSSGARASGRSSRSSNRVEGSASARASGRSSRSSSSSGVEGSASARASGRSSSSSSSSGVEGSATASAIGRSSSSSTPAVPEWALAPFTSFDPEYARCVQAALDAEEAARSAQAAEPAGTKRARVKPKCPNCRYAHEGPGCVYINHNYLYSQPKSKGIVDEVLAAPVVPAQEREYLRRGFRPSTPAHNSTTNL